MSGRLHRRKLLVASIGIASVSYVVGTACLSDGVTSGNLPGPPPGDGSAADTGIPPTSGNLPAPPPPDASDASDAGDAGDASDDAADAGEDADAGS